MKTLIMLMLCFWLLPVLPACDEALPSSPIAVVGDTIYVFPLDIDDVCIDNWGYS